MFSFIQYQIIQMPLVQEIPNCKVCLQDKNQNKRRNSEYTEKRWINT